MKSIKEVVKMLIHTKGYCEYGSDVSCELHCSLYTYCWPVRQVSDDRESLLPARYLLALKIQRIENMKDVLEIID